MRKERLHAHVHALQLQPQAGVGLGVGSSHRRVIPACSTSVLRPREKTTAMIRPQWRPKCSCGERTPPLLQRPWRACPPQTCTESDPPVADSSTRESRRAGSPHGLPMKKAGSNSSMAHGPWPMAHCSPPQQTHERALCSPSLPEKRQASPRWRGMHRAAQGCTGLHRALTTAQRLATAHDFVTSLTAPTGARGAARHRHLIIEPPVTARKARQRVVNKQTHHKHHHQLYNSHSAAKGGWTADPNNTVTHHKHHHHQQYNSHSAAKDGSHTRGTFGGLSSGHLGLRRRPRAPYVLQAVTMHAVEETVEVAVDRWLVE